jgi:TolA-binding protein
MKIFFVLFVCLIFYACSPVRTRYPFNPITKDTVSETKETESKILEDEPITQQKKDILLNDTISSVSDVEEKNEYRDYLSELFNSALEKFDRKEFKNASNDFKLLMNTLEKGDSLQLEASFFYAECLIELNDYSVAEILLNDLRNIENKPDSISEKVLVRLGQLYCILNAKERALMIFEEFHQKYPDSIYKPLAKCD